MGYEVTNMEKDSLSGYSLAFVIAVVIVVALANTVQADTGIYNYNISIANPAANQSIGSDMLLRAFVAYNNASVREYPCILTFYSYIDNTTMFSNRVYTDELGQLLYTARVGDNFENGYNYTYEIQCSNTTASGKLLITTNTQHTFLSNILTWMKQPNNVTFIIAMGGFAFIALVALLAANPKGGK